MTRKHSRAAPIGTAVLLASMCLGLWVTRDTAVDDLADAARRAALDRDWATGFAAYLSLAERRPGDAEVRVGLLNAAGNLLAELPTVSSEVQRELVDWLAESGNEALLSTALDRCTAPISAGPFVMGSETGRADERPARLVFLDAYRIDRYEVTNAQYARFVAATGREPPGHWIDGQPPAGTAAHPVLAVGWGEAAAYCAWAGRRLPTEAEWERACRGTEGRQYPWGDGWDPSLANVGPAVPTREPEPLSTNPYVHLVAQPQPAGQPGPRQVGSVPTDSTPEGILDLAGNAAEWVADWYDRYGDLPDRDPVGVGPPWNHVLRGSSWLDRYGRPDWVAGDARCASRNASHAVDVRFGFRCAVDGLGPPPDPPVAPRGSRIP